MNRSSAASLLIILGGVLFLAGILVWFGWFRWLGRLPGDIRIERPTFRLYVPITSMLLLSVIVSIVAAIVRRWTSRP